MVDLFLEADGVKTEGDAAGKSFAGALQHNSTYLEGVGENSRRQFRAEWAKLIRAESKVYVRLVQPVSDNAHCEAIRRIADSLSDNFGKILKGPLRFGTSQKALNLYLKYLWRLGNCTTPPPHCPVDSIVLAEAKIHGAWTKCNSERQYMEWIEALRMKAQPQCLAEWEYRVWLQRALKKRSASVCS